MPAAGQLKSAVSPRRLLLLMVGFLLFFIAFFGARAVMKVGGPHIAATVMPYQRACPVA